MTMSGNHTSPAGRAPFEGAPPALRLEGVTLDFGGLRALDSVSLAVRVGERRAIIGPNGAGKTSLFNIVSGELRASAGRQFFFGRDMTRMPSHRRAALGLGRTFQITSIFPGLTVQDNARLAATGCSARKYSLFGTPAADAAGSDRIASALEACGLAGRERVLAKELSYGEQRQLELSLALAMAPRVLLLDEPAAGLSPAERTGMAAAIRRLPRDLTLLLIEHDMDLALGLVDTVTCLHYGRIIMEGTPDAVRGDANVQEVYLGKAAAHA